MHVVPHLASAAWLHLSSAPGNASGAADDWPAKIGMGSSQQAIAAAIRPASAADTPAAVAPVSPAQPCQQCYLYDAVIENQVQT